MAGESNSLLNRRDFIAGIGAAGTAFTMFLGCEKVSFTSTDKGNGVLLPDLPYAEDALSPYISSKTISFHYGKHHRGYVDKTLKMIAGTEFEGADLEEIILATANRPDKTALFNNAAQVYNHAFYWKSMKPGGGGAPGKKVLEKIQQSFGSYDKFAETFTQEASTKFGSGWAWLVSDVGSLKVLQTSNADTPITDNMKPLITIDVWEHAYYLDYQNRRADYVKAFLDSLVNWDFAEQNLG
jgi:Fe-Mn family superoxide dismutase